MQLSVIIPSYKGQQLLAKSLPPLVSSLSAIGRSEIIVIDNGSKDATITFLKKQYPTIRRVELETNYGFTKAVNEGFRRAKGSYVLILNNDCIVQKDSISKLIRHLEKYTDLVATQPIVMRPDGTIENIGYVVDLKKGRATVATDKNLIPAFDNQTIWDSGFAYGLSGACLLLRKETIKTIGLFDESFHSYLEDVDFFIRLAERGHEYAACKEASVTHKHMSTSINMKGYKEWHDMINWIRIIKKNYPSSFVFRHAGSLFVERIRNLSGWLKSISRV